MLDPTGQLQKDGEQWSEPWQLIVCPVQTLSRGQHNPPPLPQGDRTLASEVCGLLTSES